MDQPQTPKVTFKPYLMCSYSPGEEHFIQDNAVWKRMKVIPFEPRWNLPEKETSKL